MNALEPSPDSRICQTAACSRASARYATPVHSRSCARLRDHSFGAIARFVARRAAQLDQQKRASVGQKPHTRHLLDARELGQILIEAFERFGTMLEHPRRLIRCDEDVVEAEHGQRDFLRARHGSNRGAQNRGERALGADDRARDIEAALRHQLVEVVAGDAARQFREMRAHRIGASGREVRAGASRVRLRGRRARLRVLSSTSVIEPCSES